MADPGEVRNQVPLLLLSLHCAPLTGPAGVRVSTDTLWFWPLTMDAQPEPSESTAASKHEEGIRRKAVMRELRC